ncbi:hypothetical protein H4R99_004073 [Coemansia sp. RSA 1722]|nr:hypothetical protein LPJ57_003861 [Coemansia sp. RSA 486]KAJ2233242.1 hypothetical protein IWW45_004341 [Coemansia sp. RSA 485]KAJ2598506.1 hypothetical protein H4R99_004073 [Coemansia sp. RSA 1722]
MVVITNDIGNNIKDLCSRGKNATEIGNELGINSSTINSYIERNNIHTDPSNIGRPEALSHRDKLFIKRCVDCRNPTTVSEIHKELQKEHNFSGCRQTVKNFLDSEGVSLGED